MVLGAGFGGEVWVDSLSEVHGKAGVFEATPTEDNGEGGVVSIGTVGIETLLPVGLRSVRRGGLVLVEACPRGIEEGESVMVE